ncbi:mechanosensitive ion channel family protein [Vibrio hannami]|uniref:mechanosensitive ion channel family protein n=1 Tax=Vibrio hannami TaxID=2717094 RepID=UPI00240F1B1C|nr:mechanosensitive ion channel family protein [Vibrio hannami]MDG3086271.1 mechanosensitive ion channel family protein [Vibrio hannami]
MKFKNIIAGIFSLLLLSLPLQASEIEKLTQYTDSVAKEIEQLKASKSSVTSSISQTMLMHQLESLTTESSNAVINYAKSDEAQESKEATVALLMKQEKLINRQQSSATKALSQLFKDFEATSIEDQPIEWVTVSNAMDYRTRLFKIELALIEAQEQLGQSKEKSRSTFSKNLDGVSSNLYVVLGSSLKLSEVLQSERSKTPAAQRDNIDSRLRMQQRMNLTFSSNLRSMIPMMEATQLDTAKFNELTFSATGELSDAMVSTDAFMAVGHNLLENITQWIVENAGSTISKVIIFILIIVLFKYLSGLVRKIMTRIVRSPQSKLSTLVQDFIVSMSAKAVMLFGILIALAQVGLNLGPLLTGLGVAGIVIGFALQDTLSNFASGMMILIYRPFDVEDFVEAGGVSGKVSHMSLVNTTIRTFDNQIFIVPNSKIWGDTIKNITAEKVRRVDMTFGIGYSDDIDKAEAVLANILEQHNKVLKSPEPTIKVMTLNESSVDFIVRPWVNTADYWEVYWDVTKTVKMRFDQEGISIPFPQRDVRLYETK